MRRDTQRQYLTNQQKSSISNDPSTQITQPIDLSPPATDFSTSKTAHIYSSNYRDEYGFLSRTPLVNDLHSQIFSLTQQTENFSGLRLEADSQFEFQKQYIAGKKPKNTMDVSDLNALVGSRKQPQYKADMADLMNNYKEKQQRDVWDKITSDSLLKSTRNEYSMERSNNFMDEAERKKLERLQQAPKTHFFDGQSKYVPLKCATNRDTKPEHIVIIKNWFKALSFEEKSIALTIVDKDLVDLIKAMYRIEFEQGQGGGQFCTLVEECRHLYDQSDLVELPKPYRGKLIYLKQTNHRNIQSQALRQKEEATNTLVENIRLVQIRRPNSKQIEYSLTIDAQLVQNYEYFMKIMKLIDEEFLMREYKLTKQTTVVGSLLYTKEEESKTRQQPYFHVSDAQKHIYSASIGTSSGISQYSLDNRQRNLEQNKITLAKCLLLSFEKGLNVHFLDYQKKLAANHQQQYFIKESEIDNNIFAQDAKLTKFWLELGQNERSNLLEHTKELEKQVVQEHNNLKSKRCEIVTETDDEDEEQAYYKQLYKYEKSELKEDPLYMKARRKRKDRQRGDGSSNQTSSSGIQSVGHSYLDYNSKQLLGYYGNDNSEDSSFDYESQRPAVKHHEELFSSNNVDNCIFKARQQLTTQGLQAHDLASTLVFIKTLSLNKPLEVSLRESSAGEICMKSVRDMECALLKMFYEYLEVAFQKKINDELFESNEVKEAPNKKKNKKKSKNKKKGAQTVPQEPAQTQANQQSEPIKNSKVLPDPPRKTSPPKKDFLDLPEIKVQFNLMRSPSPTNDSVQSSSDDFDRQMRRQIQEAQKVEIQQLLQLNRMAHQIQHINTAEDILDQGGVTSDGAGCDFLEQLLLDRLHDADLLQQSPFHKSLQAERRYEEERTGLLSNKVHAEKYTNEVELAALRQKYTQQEQVRYSLNQDQQKLQNYGSSDSEQELTLSLKQQINSLADEIEPEPIQKNQPYAAPEQASAGQVAPQPKNNKKKKRKNKNKNKGQQATIQEPQKVVVPALQEQSIIKIHETLDADVDEIQQVEAKPEQKPELNTLKNNFVNDNESYSSSNPSNKSSSHITYINNPENNIDIKTQEISKALAHRIMEKAAKDASVPKKEQRKGKKKVEEIKKDELKPTLSLLCPSQPQQTVSILKEKPVPNFELDLSDKVKIPGRGKSISSYGKEELQHEQTLQELDSLFRSSDREFNSSSSGKLRSSTVDKQQRKPSKNYEETIISQFNVLDDLEDDIISHKMPNVRRHADDLVDNKPEAQKIVQIAVESVPAIKQQRKKTEKKIKDIEAQREPEVQQVQVIENAKTFSSERPQTQPQKPDHSTQTQPRQNQRHQSPLKQDSKAKEHIYQPRKQHQPQTKQQFNQPKSSQQQQKNTSNLATSTQHKTFEKSNQQKTQNYKAQEVPNKSKQQITASKSNESAPPKIGSQLPYDSWGAMFETVYGGGVAAIPNQQLKRSISTQKAQTTLSVNSREPIQRDFVNDQDQADVEKITISDNKPVSHEVESPSNYQKQSKLTKKQLKKQQLVLAEQGIMTTPHRIQAPILASDQNQSIDQPVMNRYKKKSFQSEYVNSSFQTIQSEGYSGQSNERQKFSSGTIQERGVATQVQQNNLQNQQITNNLTYNIFPPQGNFQLAQVPYQQYQMQMPQPGQQYQKQHYHYTQPHKYSNPGPQQLQAGIPPAFQYHPDQYNFPPQYVSESFFKLRPLSDHPNPYYQQQEDRFYFEIGRQLTQLQREIENRLSESEQARALCLDLICKIARDTFPELSLSFDVYGSMATKLAIDTSDMDIAIYGIQPEARVQALQTLHEKFEGWVSVRQNTLIATASVPVIKLELNFEGLSEDLKIAQLKIGKITSIKIDIVINSQDANEIHQTKKCAEFVKKQTQEHPFLKPITLALKKYLALKNLNSPFQGTMSSYGIVLLVLALLKDIQRQGPNFENPLINHQTQVLINLGQGFTHFFFVYGSLFNDGVIINGKLEFVPNQQETLYSGVASALQIQDPVDPTNNVGKQIYNFFSTVQEQFTVTNQVIQFRFKEIQQKMCESDHNYNQLMYISNQKSNSFNKAIENQSHLQHCINQLNQKIQTDLSRQLDHIIMVTIDSELSPIVRDEVEERQKGLLQYQKSLSLLVPPDMRNSFQNTYFFFHPHNLGIDMAQSNDATGPFQQQFPK